MDTTRAYTALAWRRVVKTDNLDNSDRCQMVDLFDEFVCDVLK